MQKQGAEAIEIEQSPMRICEQDERQVSCTKLECNYNCYFKSADTSSPGYGEDQTASAYDYKDSEPNVVPLASRTSK